MTIEQEIIKIRTYHPSDLISLYKICLLTGDSGKDASTLYKDHDLLGHFYAAPYAIYEPELIFIVTVQNQPCGYILGTKNSRDFFNKCESGWFPILRERYPKPDENDTSPDANIIKRLHIGHITKEDMNDYPAHLHIDLLPEAQGKGLGRKLINIFIEKLSSFNITGLHLEVGKRNPGAVEFYKRTGFHLIKESEYSFVFGINLSSGKI